MYDEKLNESAIATLKWAPVFMMLFGFWIMGNRQIFENHVEPSERKTDPVTTDHKGFNISFDQSFPLLIIGAAMFFFIFFNDLLQSILVKFGLAADEKEIEVDEKLGCYVQCLGPRKRKLWKIEELHLRKEFGI